MGSRNYHGGPLTNWSAAFVVLDAEIDPRMITPSHTQTVPAEVQSVVERLEEAAREIGVLLVAFAPLDPALNAAEGRKSASLLYFVLLGLCLFAVAFVMERHRTRRDQP